LQPYQSGGRRDREGQCPRDDASAGQDEISARCLVPVVVVGGICVRGCWVGRAGRFGTAGCRCRAGGGGPAGNGLVWYGRVGWRPGWSARCGFGRRDGVGGHSEVPAGVAQVAVGQCPVVGEVAVFVEGADLRPSILVAQPCLGDLREGVASADAIVIVGVLDGDRDQIAGVRPFQRWPCGCQQVLRFGATRLELRSRGGMSGRGGEGCVPAPLASEKRSWRPTSPKSSSTATG
jgi:hypothetical protein